MAVGPVGALVTSMFNTPSGISLSPQWPFYASKPLVRSACSGERAFGSACLYSQAGTLPCCQAARLLDIALLTACDGLQGFIDRLKNVMFFFVSRNLGGLFTEIPDRIWCAAGSAWSSARLHDLTKVARQQQDGRWAELAWHAGKSRGCPTASRKEFRGAQPSCCRATLLWRQLSRATLLPLRTSTGHEDACWAAGHGAPCKPWLLCCSLWQLSSDRLCCVTA